MDEVERDPERPEEFGPAAEQFDETGTTDAWIERTEAIIGKLDEWLRIVDQIRLAARRAHRIR